jgi:hypothetical protein
MCGVTAWMPAFAFWQVDGSRNAGPRRPPRMKPCTPQLVQMYLRTLQGNVPHGVVQIPLIIRHMNQTDYQTLLVAGSVGTSVINECVKGTTAGSKSEWWMLCFEKKEFDLREAECKI